MRRVFLVLALLSFAAAAPAFTTPGTGVRWTADDLVTYSAGAVTGSRSAYSVHETVVVAVSDTLDLTTGHATFTFQDTSGLMELDVNGALISRYTTFTSANQQPGDWYGIRFRDTGPYSMLQIHGGVIEYGNYGVDVVYHDIDLFGVTIRYTDEKALDLTGAGGTVRQCKFEDNQRQTIYMTLSSSPLIETCELRRNNLVNSNPYPYINIGLQGTNSPTIRLCHIEGGQHMSGGIAIWNSSQATIEQNIIRDCGYGILCYSVGANPTIRDNAIFSNTIHPDTVNWGFGIACNGDNQPIIQENRIYDHWYGIAITGGAEPDLGGGAGSSLGFNALTDNGLGGEIYAIFNNTSNPISAENNYFGVFSLAEIEDHIWHGVDDPSLGMVDYDPAWFGEVTGSGDVVAALELHGAAPNPFNPRTHVVFSLGQDAPVVLDVHDARGRRVRTLSVGRLGAGRHEILFDGNADDGRSLPSGVYLYRLRAGDVEETGRMQLVR